MAMKPPLRLSRPDAGKSAINLASPEFQAFVGGGRGGEAPVSPAIISPPLPTVSSSVKETEINETEIKQIGKAVGKEAGDKKSKPKETGENFLASEKQETIKRGPTLLSLPVSSPVTENQTESIRLTPQLEKQRFSDPYVLESLADAEPSSLATTREEELEEELEELSEDGKDVQAIGLRIPELTARKLDRLAETWVCHRHQIMLDLLAPRLKQLAEEVARGAPPRIPPLPPAKSSRKRTITIRLKPEMAEDLNRVVSRYRSVKSMVLTRLLVPAIETVYQREAGGKG
jgi:predicted transcriptional regulator